MDDTVEKILSLRKGRDCDALIFQPCPPDSDHQAHYDAAIGIILRLNNSGRISYAFHTLLPINSIQYPGPGTYGHLSDIIHIADYQFANDRNSCEWIAVKYSDPDFPQSLFPYIQKET